MLLYLMLNIICYNTKFPAWLNTNDTDCMEHVYNITCILGFYNKQIIMFSVYDYLKKMFPNNKYLAIAIRMLSLFRYNQWQDNILFRKKINWELVYSLMQFRNIRWIRHMVDDHWTNGHAVSHLHPDEQAGFRTAAVEFWKHLLDASSSLLAQGRKLLFRM